MSDIVKIVGERVKNYRNKLGLSQEELAGRAKLHSTYIGQLERGEKNATLESIEKVALALGVSLENLFEKIVVTDKLQNNVPLEIYQMVNSLSKKEQNSILEIIKGIIKFKSL